VERAMSPKKATPTEDDDAFDVCVWERKKSTFRLSFCHACFAKYKVLL
jgi:hypothetical protein